MKCLEIFTLSRDDDYFDYCFFPGIAIQCLDFNLFMETFGIGVEKCSLSLA